MRPVAIVSAVLSALVPGLGQLLRRRWVEAALFLSAAVYVRLLLAGLAGAIAADARTSGLVLGAFGVDGGLRQPTFVVMTVLAVTLHVIAAWDAGRAHARATSDAAAGSDPPSTALAAAGGDPPSTALAAATVAPATAVAPAAGAEPSLAPAEERKAGEAV